jgi:hypothetical protein
MKTHTIKVPFIEDLSIEVTTQDVVSKGCGIGAGLLAGYTTEKIIDALLPEVSGLTKLATTIGKWAIADLVGLGVADETEQTVRECFETIDEVNTKIDEIVKMALEENDD